MTQANLMTDTTKNKLAIVTDQAETFLGSSKETFFNKTPRIVSPLGVHKSTIGGYGGARTTRNLSPVRRSGGAKLASDEVQETFEKVMNDERRYDEIRGPDRHKMRLDE